MQTGCRKENANKIELYKPIGRWIRWGRGDPKNIMFEDEEEWDVHLENDDRWVIRTFSLDFTNNHLWGRQSNKRHSYNFKFIKKEHICIYKCVYRSVLDCTALVSTIFTNLHYFLKMCPPLFLYMYIIYINKILYIIIITIITNKGQKKVNEMNYNCEICGSQDRVAESSVLVL